MKVPAEDVKIARFFTWREACYLPHLSRMATEEDGFTEQVADNLIKVFQVMDQIRQFFGERIRVHCAWRPEHYNHLVGGAAGSAHMAAKAGEAAVDFDIPGMECDDVRAALLPKLEELGIRMEATPGTGWVHIDTRVPPPGHPRYFKP